MAVSATLDTNLGLTARTVFDDDETPASTQCTGDAQAIGEAGAVFSPSVPCTDPGTSCTGRLQSRTRIVAAPAALTPAGVRQLAEQGLAPLTVSASAMG